MLPRLFGARLTSSAALLWVFFAFALPLDAQYLRHPGPGEVFRDHRLANTGTSWRVTDPEAKNERAIQTLPNEVYGMLVGDLEGAVRAELIIDYWGGHPGTDVRHVRFNSNEWLELPDLVTGTPNPNCYLQLVNFVIDIPVSHLTEGINTLEGLSGGQVCYDFRWGMWGMYGVVLRVYYDPEVKDHPTGGIARPAPGSVINDNPLILVNASSNVGIDRVDFLAYYNGYDPDGDGRFTDWHLSYRDGAKLKDHIGTDSTIPYRRRWNTNLVPDQPVGSVKLKAYITDNDGYTYVSEEVGGLTLKREDTSVRLYRSSGIPENFLTRDHETNEVYFTIPKDDDLSSAETAFLLVRSWNGLDPKTTTRVGSWVSPIFGRDHRPDFDRLGMGDGSNLVNGLNVLSITNTEEEEHGPEILWPGPAIVVRYNSGPRKPTVFPALYGFDDEGGLTAFDLTNNGNDGVLVGNVARASNGRYGSGLEFDGVSGHVDLGVVDFTGTELTVSMWAYIDSAIQDPNARLFAKAIGTRGTEGQLIISLNNTNGIRYRLATTTGFEDVVTHGSLTLDAWNHVAVTYDGSAMRIYVNGTQRKATFKTGAVDNGSNVPVWLGDNPGGERRPLLGRIDELRIYNIAQSATQIVADMQTPVVDSDLTPPSIPSSLAASLDTKTSAYLTWNESIDESEVSGYRIYRDGVQAGFSAVNTFTEYDLFPNRTYTYTVTALDRQGNESAQSNSATVITPPDLQPPTTPQNLTAEASAFSASLSWNTAFDDTAVSHYRIYRNGREVATSTSTTYSDSGLDVETSYAYQVMAVDTIGNFSGLSNRVVVTTLSEPPNPTLLLGLPFEEISGELALDSSGYRYDGTITSGVRRSEDGKIGRSIRFSGNGGLVDVGNLDIPGAAMTIAAWIKADDFGVKDARIISKATGSSDNQHYWMLSTVNGTDGIKARARLKTTSGRTKTLEGATTLPANEWVHIAFTYDGELMRLYVNGVLDNALEHSGDIARNSRVPVAVGDQPQGGRNFDGLIDELQIHTVVMSEEEVQRVMQERLPGPGGANLPPTISEIPDQVIFGDTSTESLPFTIGDESTSAEDLEISVDSSDKSIVPLSGIVLNGSGAQRTISATPVSGRTGSVDISIEVSDGEDSHVEVFAVMVVTPGNTAPTISAIADQNVVVDSSSGVIEFTVGDGETPVDQLTLFAESSNLDLLPVNGIAFGGSGAERSVTITPKKGEIGSATVRIFVSDGEFSIAERLAVNVNPPVSESLWLGMPFEEGFGNTVFDVSEHGNDGALSSGVSRSEEGQIGRSLLFSGGGGLVDLGNLDIPGSGLTLAAWIKPADFGVSDGRIISKASGVLADRHFWMLSTVEDGGDIKLRMRLKTTLGDTETLVGSTSLSAGEWIHVAGTYDGSEMKLFINGREDASLPVNGAIAQNATVPAAIGNQPQGGNGFSGLIDEVHIYTQALSVGGLQEVMGLALDPPNAAPYISLMDDREIFVNTNTGAIPFVIGDAETAPYLLDLQITSSNQTLVPQSAIRLSGVGNNRDLTITPAAGRTGHAVITITLGDGEYVSEETFKLTVVTPGNTEPTISSINDLQIVPSSSSGPIPFIVTDATTPPGDLNLSVVSSNPELVPPEAMTFGGSGTQRTLTVSPASGLRGTAEITVSVDDGEYEVQESFKLSVVPAVHPDLWVHLPMDETSGNDVFDLSSYRNDARLTFGVSRAQAEGHGGTLVFSGNGGQANLGNLDIPGAKFSIAAWIRPDDFGVEDARIISKATGLTDNQHYWMLSTVEGPEDKIKLRGRLSTIDGDHIALIGNETLSAGVWTHVAMVYDGSELRLYVNGLLDASTPFGGAVAKGTSVPVAIGDQPQGGKNFDGLIDDLKIYKTDLSETQVQTIMTGILGVPNAAPAITPMDDINVLVNTSTVPMEFRLSDVQTSPYLLNLTVSSDNADLIPPSGIILGGSGGTRTITLVPTRDTTGTATIRIAVSDGDFTTEESFLVNVVTPGNTKPTVSPIEDIRIIPGVSTGPIPFTVNDTETVSEQITVTAKSSNEALVPLGGISLGGSGANRTISISPASGQVGESAITISASDGELSYEETFVLTVESAIHPDLVLGLQFEEASGSTAIDDSGNGNNGALSAGVTRSTEGHTGSAVVFSGVGGQIDVGNIDVGGTHITLAAWIRADDFGVPDARIISKASGPRDNDHFWMLSTVGGTGGTKLRMRLKTTGGDTLTVVGTTNLSAGVWTHVAGTYDGSEARLYVNGILDASLPWKGSVVEDPGVPVAIGNQPQGGNSFDGRVDDVQVYEASFDQAQIQAMMTQSLDVPNTPPSISPIDDHYVFMNRGTGPIAFTLSDVETTGYLLDVSIRNDNPSLVPASGIKLGGEGFYRNLEITPAAGMSGAATLTIAVNDGEFTTEESFILRVVTPGNTPPTISPISNQNINFGSSTNSLAFTIGDAETTAGDLTVSAKSSNPVMVPPSAFQFGGSGSNRTITVTPASIQTGTALITVTVTDGEMLTEETFNLSVNPPFDTSLYLGMPFEEVSGASTYDLSPYAHNGRLTGEVARSYFGKFGRALEFSGGTGHVDLFNMDIPGSRMTIATWIKPDDFGTTDARIVSKANSSSLNDHYWMLSTIPFQGEIKLRLRLKTEGNSTTTLVGATTLPAGEWTHVAATYDGSYIKLYVNGQLDAEMSHYGAITQNAGVPVVIGDQPQGGRNFDGLIDDFRIYTQALDQANINSIMSSPLVDVGPINIPPTVTDVADQEVFQGHSTAPLLFVVGDTESDAGDLIVTASSSDSSLVPASGLVISGEGGTRSLVITPAAGKHGTAIISLSVDDGQDEVIESFVLDVKRGLGSAGWWNPDWEFRTSVEIGANGVARGEAYGDVPVNFTELLAAKGISASIDQDTVHVVEVDAGGYFLDEKVPFQFDADPDYDPQTKASGTLVIKLTGSTPANTSRFFQVYFTSIGSDATPPAIPNEISLTDNALDEGQLSFRVATPHGIMFYHKPGAGFSSWLDKQGNDWISYRPTGGSSGSYRGIPQMAFDDNKFHPDFATATSTLRSAGPVKVTVHSITNNGQAECIWEFYSNYTRLTMLKADQSYWFLYEGTPGGSFDKNTDFLVRSDGVKNLLADRWTEDLPDEEWMYVTDPDVGRSVFFASHTDDNRLDTYSPLDDKMTVVGFGRELLKPQTYLTGVPRSFTMGLVDQTNFTPMKAAIHSAYKELTYQVSATQRQSESNNAPNVTITAPLNGFTFTEDDPITFTATAADVENGNVTSSIKWSSNRDGALPGSGNTIVVSSLSVGTHEITATARDSGGLEGSRSIVLTINPNTEPSVDISLPANGSTFIQGEPVFFTASAADVEDGNITNKIRWSSSINGSIGSVGGSISVSNLSPGNHTITASATDFGGLAGADSLTLTIAAPSTRPTVNITAPANKAFYTQGQTISLGATAIDAEDGNITSKIKWKSDIDGAIAGTGGSVSVSNLTAGIHTITATALDTGLLPGEASILVTVGVVSTPPAVTITNPFNGAYYSHGDNIGFRAVATDVEDGTLTSTIRWRSSIDGPMVGTGGAIFNSGLSVGEHTITATATDTGYLPGSASIDIVVAEPSTLAEVEITSPSHGTFVPQGQSVTFTATANDAEDGNIASSLVWRSNRDGVLPGTGPSVTAPALTAGAHTITATATDSGLLPSSDSIQVFVGTQSNAPVVNIIAPAESASYNRGDAITFVANATDQENGDLTSRITWSSSIDGPVGDVGGTLSIATLSVGVHTITATAVDSGFVPGFDTVKVIVRAVSFPPTVVITNPNSDIFVNRGESVAFAATASDIEDGDLTSDIVWKSSRDGQFATGGTISSSSLSVGVHTISAVAEDSGLLPGGDTVRVTVREVSTPPAVTITAPVGGSFFAQGQLVTFKATATDAEDGNVTGTIHWTSNLDGSIPGNGGAVSTTALSVGVHTMTATAIDSGFLPGSSSMTVAISEESNAPVVVITSPEDGAFANQGEVVTFTANGIDADDGDITDSITWISNKDGTLPGTGGTLAISTLSVGTHVITARGIDSGFLPGQDKVTFTVRGVSEAPVVTISTPSDGATFSHGQMIDFTATAVDAEDGNVASSLIWRSSIDGVLGTGGEVSTPVLSVGTHTITAEVTDSGLQPGSDSMEVTILPLIGQFVSDDFSEASLDPEIWTVVDPVGDGEVSLNGGALEIKLPEGVDHDIWTNGNLTTRVMQEVFDTDFELEVRFTSPMDNNYQMQGFLIEQDEDNFLRFDFVRFPSNIKAYSASFIGTTPTTQIDQKISFGDNYYIRVNRTGNLWTMHYSFDGEAWELAGRYRYDIEVRKVGLYAGNASGADSPDFTLIADYVYNTAVPVYNEDSQISIVTSGDGGVEIDEAKDYYGSGEEITLTAVPEEGWEFVGWAGDIAELENPLTFNISDDLEVYALFYPTDGRPIIDVWYGDRQKFGVWGVPQPQVNILGNIIISEQIESVSYSLNGVFQGELSMGLSDNIRLARPGDFNIEIPYTDLNEGENTVTIHAEGFDGEVYERDVIVESSIYNVWPRPYAVDWSQVSRIDDVGQVVDGKWEIVAGGVRSVEPHYDRLIAIGDIDWTDFEVTVPITVHDVDFQPPPNEPLVGVMLRWDGHEKNFADEQPGTEWRPIGAMGVHGWYVEGPRGGHHFQIFETGSKKYKGYNGESMEVDQTYYFKFRVETIEGRPAGLYSMKVWPAGQLEPNGWGIVRQADEGGLVEGSLLLVAHYVDATFGNIVVSSLEDNENPTVEITSPQQGHLIEEGAPLTFTATAHDPEDGELSDEITWRSSLDGPLPGIGRTITTSDLSLGKHVITAVVVDGDSAPNIDRVTVTIGINTPPTVNIVTPADGYSELSGYPISFSATATDPNQGDVSNTLVWVSNIDGPLAGTGGSIFAPVFSLGTHQITATATDAGGLQSSDTITLEITENDNNEPDVILTSPSSGGVYKEGDTIGFTAVANDSEDGELTGDIKWSSDLDGLLPVEGGAVSIAGLSVGVHRITASATDSGYFTGADSISIEIDANIPPSVSITSPNTGVEYTLNDMVSLSAFAIDTEEGDLTDQLAWSSSIDGDLALSGGSVSTSNLSVGIHKIRATVTDTVGATVFDEITVRILTPKGPVTSDDFDGSDIKKNLWTFHDPKGDSGYGVTQGILQLFVGGGVEHDIWDNLNESVRLYQRVNDEDFGMQAKFVSTPTAKYQYHGVLVEQDAFNFIRFDIMSTGDELRAFGASFVNGTPTVLFNQTMSVGRAYYLQVVREGDRFTLRYATHGKVWQDAAVLNRSMIVNKVDVHAGNAEGSSSPPYTALVDYFFNTASPIVPEDEGGINTPPQVDITSPASGKVFKFGQEVVFEGKAIDAESGNISSSLTWASNRDGALPGKGSSISSRNLTIGTHEITASTLDPESVEGSDSVTIRVNDNGPLVGDTFNTASLNENLWTTVDPKGDSTFTMDSGSLNIFLPAESTHDVWENGNQTARVMQNIDNSNFGMEVGFNSPLNQRFQLQGITIEQDENNFIRFDFVTSGSAAYVFAASFVDNVPTAIFNKPVGSYQNYFLRVIREGSIFNMFYSFDGSNWLYGGSYARNMTVNRLGAHAGNAPAGELPAPEFTSKIDYIKSLY